jgi:hypothetical protein
MPGVFFWSNPAPDPLGRQDRNLLRRLSIRLSRLAADVIDRFPAYAW